MALIILLLVLFVVLGGVGLVFKGLVWLAITAAVLFVITGVIGFVQRKNLTR